MGTPPQPHLDVIVMTDDEYELGDEVQVRVVGVFRRSDGDHKFVGVPESREANDFTELTESEISDMNRLYRKKREGDGWFGRETVEKIIVEFFSRM